MKNDISIQQIAEFINSGRDALFEDNLQASAIRGLVMDLQELHTKHASLLKDIEGADEGLINLRILASSAYGQTMPKPEIVREEEVVITKEMFATNKHHDAEYIRRNDDGVMVGRFIGE